MNSVTLSRLKLNTKDKNRIFNKYLELRETMLMNNKFDINYYLDNAKTKYIFRYLDKKDKNSNNNSTDFNKSKKITNNIKQKNSFNSKYNRLNLSVSNNKKLKLDFPNVPLYTSKNSFKNIYKQKFGYLETNTNYDLNSIKTNNLNSKINTRYNTLNDGHDNFFNVEKMIKSIKLKEKNFDFKSYINKAKNYTDKKNALIAINSDNLLKNYSKSKRIKDTKDISVSTFITQKKEISINNLLIKIMNIESKKLQKTEQEITKDLQNNKINIETEEKTLDEYTDNQKIECKQLESTLKGLLAKHSNLKKEEKELMLEVKVKEFEIYKLLIKINLYRYYAKFSNTVLDGDPSRFNKPILPENHEFEKIDLEPIIDDVINNYWNIKGEDKIRKMERKRTTKGDNLNRDKKYSIKYKEEGYFLYNPDFLYLKYKEFEGNILRLLTTKEKLIIKKIKREKQSNEALSYLIDRCNDLKEEYLNLCKLYNLEKKKHENNIIDNSSSHIDINLSETNSLIKDLYTCVVDILENPLAKLCKRNKKDIINPPFNKKNFDDLIKYGKNLVKHLEINLNILLDEISEERKEDRKTFDKVIKDLKIYYKMVRQSHFEKNKISENEIKRSEIFEKQNNIKMIYRKDEPPYYKGRPKKVKIDIEAIKMEEDKDLINFQ